ncbi:MAG: ribonuclease D [Sedimentisphaeraceae bacterium JB056]
MTSNSKTIPGAVLPDFTYIDTDSAADDLIVLINDSQWAGIDIEGSSLHSFSDNVSLVQLSLESGIYIVDPLSGIDMAAVLSAISGTELILHGGDYDLRMLLADYGFRPKKAVFDTMLGAELLGIESIGLAAVVELFFGEKMCKAGQKSNWTQRPLTPSQLKYASTDVVYLKELKDRMSGQLDELGRLSWWSESNARLVERSGQSKDAPTKEPWRIKGSRDLSPSELRYLRAIWQWRNDIAKNQNRPVFKICGNDVILKLSLWIDANPGKNPKKFNSLPKSCRGKSYELLCEYIKNARKLEKSEWPSHVIRRQSFWVEPDKELIDKIREYVRSIAEDLGIKPQLLLTRAKMEAVARSMPRSESQIAVIADLMAWQKNIIAPAILDILVEHSV